ncbi:MAG: 2-oxoglutarate dehydrogenase complex dihydrolipoyllysine-residue succinyltransferase [Chitinophagales bacterium]|nr:2-oxoglutarate dehydrogenase complex dihydrolipoyllysine-residue succinyltransferase [Chitinophagales bacterium]
MKHEIKIPTVGESVVEVTLAEWLVKDGDIVAIDQALAEIESDKATFELPAEVAGKIEIKANDGDDLEIGAVIGYIDDSFATSDAPKKEEKKETPKQEVVKEEPKQATKQEAPKVETKVEKQESTNDSYAKGTPSPAAKKILDEKNVAANEVQGTGKDQRITKSDALKATPRNLEEALLSNKTASREETVEKLSRMRKTIARRLVDVKNQTAMLTTFNEVDMSAILDLRKQYKDAFAEKHGIGLGFMSFFTKACSTALMQFPKVNAYIDDENMILHDYADISIAVSTDKGLVVPVIRNAEVMSFADIELEIKRLASLARKGELKMEDMEGGTFTITNGGVFGSLLSTPIINQPQSAILGMHKIEERPIVENGQIIIKPMMYLALSYDHRIIDGKDSVSFLVAVKDYLEHPEKMLFGTDPNKVLLDL